MFLVRSTKKLQLIITKYL